MHCTGVKVKKVGSPHDLEIVQQHEHLNINTSLFTKYELEIARSAIKEGKAFGDDKVPLEDMKRCDLEDIILHLCNKALVDGLVTDRCRLSNIIPIPKKGDLTDTNNYRCTSLTCLVAKTLNKMILNKISQEIENLL